MTDIADRYRRLSRRFTDLIEAVPAAQWSSPSPCSDWTAGGVLEHVVMTEVDFYRRHIDPSVSFDGLDASATWPQIRDLVQSALDDPARAATPYDGMLGPTTFAATIDQFYSLDLVVHAWDIARATGASEFLVIPGDEIVAATAAIAPLVDLMRQPGGFGPEIDVADDVDPQTRLLAVLGRAG